MKHIALIIVFLFVLSFQFSVFSQDNKNRKEPVTPATSVTPVTPVTPVTIEEQVTPDLYVVNNKLYVKNVSTGKKVEIITIIGNKIREIQITSSPDFEQELNLPRAIYIFRTDGIIKKFIIK